MSDYFNPAFFATFLASSFIFCASILAFSSVLLAAVFMSSTE
jgi:hypothetical protein